MVLDNEICSVAGCTFHVYRKRTTPQWYRNEQIRDDWLSGVWTLEELSSFWGLKPLSITNIVRGAEQAREGTPPLEVVHSC